MCRRMNGRAAGKGPRHRRKGWGDERGAAAGHLSARPSGGRDRGRGPGPPPGRGAPHGRRPRGDAASGRRHRRGPAEPAALHGPPRRETGPGEDQRGPARRAGGPDQAERQAGAALPAQRPRGAGGAEAGRRGQDLPVAHPDHRRRQAPGPRRARPAPDPRHRAVVGPGAAAQRDRRQAVQPGCARSGCDTVGPARRHGHPADRVRARFAAEHTPSATDPINAEADAPGGEAEGHQPPTRI